MKIDGGCHCGSITYEAEADPEKVTLCHCTDCQTLSASAFRVVVPVAEVDFNILTGTPKEYVKTAESGNKRAQGFCPDCGTNIYATSAGGDGPKVFGLRTATTRQRDQLTPKRQVWFRSAQPWVTDIAAVPQVETQ
jgi:hypothetical protein